MTDRRRIVVISQVWASGSPSERLPPSRFELRWRHDLVHIATPDELVEGLDGAWAVVAGAESYPAEVVERLPVLRAIARPGVGVDAIDIGAATRFRIAVLTTPGANDDSVADHTVALILAGLRRLVELDRRTRVGAWRPREPGRELFRATVGVIGLGAIGRAVVRRLGGFECRVLAVEPRPDHAFCARHGVELRSLEQVLPDVDVLTVHVPLLPETRGLIGDRELRLLPPHALVVNASRGAIIDEAALAAALTEGRLGGAALDVFDHEPVRATDPLVALPTTTLTPHHAAFTEQAIRRMVDSTAAGLADLAEGVTPTGCINPEVLESARHGTVRTGAT
jgi:phosphoglycerate dehydrogenase-like enzyme